MAKFKFLQFGAVMSLFTAPVVVASCSKEEKTIKLIVNKPWYGTEKHEFFNKIAEIYNSKDENKQKIKIEVNYSNDNNNLANNVIKGTSDIAVITTSLFNAGDNPNLLLPLIQTTTRAFNFDKHISYYENGTENGPLRTIANKAYRLFSEKPYAEWTNSEYQWNGSIYQKFYAELNDRVSYYRGLVMLQGNEEEINQITEAWNNKDWNTFRNFGIVTGDNTSGSKYLLQEALFKKHFNKPNNLFISFANDKINHSEKYMTGKPRDIGQGALQNFHIVFDELGSFGYTNNTKGGKLLNYYKPSKPDAKISFLTTTGPLNYSIFAASKLLPKDIAEAFSKALIEAWEQGEDDYGPTVGFNGYKLITNAKNQVIDPFTKVMGS
ncbi:ABC transporter thiamine pyrophosphate-binding lipoprotein p37/Cypl [Metamycoplasma neophronis]|uniref:Alkylphosphonate ABC transporter substrate-binidng protein n=1 Tax=Metamycoplasma neophronis TaxID=872983 RepID=A0ABY2Z138_9BACT|nr:alkylphosphonate ABC transporter substrate-binidng protein [Metamycoplasma neophronis]TPR54687.1 alkylphosphonate ABC transporter substrate-binidng protein [Metamycoplasma neophronis]